LWDVVAERLDLILPPAKELGPVHRAGLESIAAIAVREPLAKALVDEGLDRLFREIELPLVPILAVLASLWLMLNLPAQTWERFVIWMVFGLVVYFAYGRRHSRVG